MLLYSHRIHKTGAREVEGGVEVTLRMATRFGEETSTTYWTLLRESVDATEALQVFSERVQEKISRWFDWFVSFSRFLISWQKGDRPDNDLRWAMQHPAKKKNTIWRGFFPTPWDISNYNEDCGLVPWVMGFKKKKLIGDRLIPKSTLQETNICHQTGKGTSSIVPRRVSLKIHLNFCCNDFLIPIPWKWFNLCGNFWVSKPIGSMVMVYLPTWMVGFLWDQLVGKYYRTRPMGIRHGILLMVRSKSTHQLRDR